jgi:hypothetical protein
MFVQEKNFVIKVVKRKSIQIQSLPKQGYDVKQLWVSRKWS